MRWVFLPRGFGFAGAGRGILGGAAAVVGAPVSAGLVAGVGLATAWQGFTAVTVLAGARRS